MGGFSSSAPSLTELESFWSLQVASAVRPDLDTAFALPVGSGMTFLIGCHLLWELLGELL